MFFYMPRGRSLWERREVKCGGGKGLENRLVPVSVQPENCPGRHSQSLQEGSLKPPEQFCCSCRAFELTPDSSSSRAAIYGEPWPCACSLSPFPSYRRSVQIPTPGAFSPNQRPMQHYFTNIV